MASSGKNGGTDYTNLRRLTEHDRKKAAEEGIAFQRFTLKDMRPAAVTDRVDAGDENITNATGHSSDRMVRQVYDRRKKKAARATE
jgi:integrase